MSDPQGPPSPLRAESRLDPTVFNLPVEKMRSGYYSDKYFVRTREALQADGHDPVVTMQLFQKDHAWVAGTDEAVAILKSCLTEGYSWEDLEVLSLRDGDRVSPYETVMRITGPYTAFAPTSRRSTWGSWPDGPWWPPKHPGGGEAAWPFPINVLPAANEPLDGADRGRMGRPRGGSHRRLQRMPRPPGGIGGAGDRTPRP